MSQELRRLRRQHFGCESDLVNLLLQSGFQERGCADSRNANLKEASVYV